jgi:hypothetical protein
VKLPWALAEGHLSCWKTYEYLLFDYPKSRKGQPMKKTGRRHTPRQNPLAVRRYDIKGTTFVVTSTTAKGAYEDATTKIRRLIRRDLSKKVEE